MSFNIVLNKSRNIQIRSWRRTRTFITLILLNTGHQCTILIKIERNTYWTVRTEERKKKKNKNKFTMKIRYLFINCKGVFICMAFLYVDKTH